MQRQTEHTVEPARPSVARTTVIIRGRAPGGEIVNEVIDLEGVALKPNDRVIQTRYGELRIGKASLQLPGVYPPKWGRFTDAALTIGGFLLRFGFGAAIFYLVHALYRTDAGTVPRPLTYVVAAIAIAAGVHAVWNLRTRATWGHEALAIFFLVAGLARFDDLLPGPLHGVAVAGFAAGWVQITREYGGESAFDRLPFQEVERRDEPGENGAGRHSFVTLSNPPDRWASQ